MLDPTAKTITAIDKLKELQADWDSYGAGTIDVSAREEAKRFLSSIEKELRPAYASPVVGPTAEGGVALIWRKPGHPKVEAFFSTSGNRYVVFHQQRILDKGTITNVAFIEQHVVL